MVRYNTDGYVPLIFFLIFFSGKFAYAAAQRLNGIYVKNGIHIPGRKTISGSTVPVPAVPVRRFIMTAGKNTAAVNRTVR